VGQNKGRTAVELSGDKCGLRHAEVGMTGHWSPSSDNVLGCCDQVCTRGHLCSISGQVTNCGRSPVPGRYRGLTPEACHWE
jgi:hypothetical protein